MTRLSDSTRFVAMKKHHTTIVLLTLFFTGLIILWWAQYAGIPTSQELEANKNFVLPELRPVSLAEIRRIEIDQRQAEGKTEGSSARRIVFVRQNDGWQMIEPMNVAADPTRVQTLGQNLKNLVKSLDAGTIEERAADFGLEPPVATIRVFGTNNGAPLASLDVGTSSRDRLYVRRSGKPGIEVVDGRLLKGINDPAAAWREHSIFNLATFQVVGITVTGPGRELKAERVRGSWMLRRPIAAPGDDAKMEDVLAELTSLRVSPTGRGFVAEDVQDLARFGLDKEHALRVELVPLANPTRPQSFQIGKPVPDQPGKVYALPGGQDDVVAVEGRELQNLGANVNALRSHKVLAFDPARVTFVRIEALGRAFNLGRLADGWQIAGASHERADNATVTRLLTGLQNLQTSEFFSPSNIAKPGLAPPSVTLKVWQATPGEKLSAKASDEPTGDLVVNLRLGRQDVGKRAVYGQLEGDPMILAFPDAFLELLPQNELAFRERSLLDLNIAGISKLTVVRDGQKIVLAPPKTGNPNQWRMLEPVEAPAETEAITKALMLLSKLRAERLVTDRPARASDYGLDNPSLTVSWSTAEPGAVAGTSHESETTLTIGSQVPKTQTWYASLSDRRLIFTLGEAILLPFREEFHTRNVLTFPVKSVERLSLRWPDRSLSFVQHPTRRGGVSDWEAAPGTILVAFDLSRVSALANEMSRLKTRKFLQYKGPLPSSSGLDHPQLTVEYTLRGETEPRRLRVGNPYGDGTEFHATTAQGDDGNVFVLAGTGWEGLVKPGGEKTPAKLPADVFAPDRGKPGR